jgi:hypothetical protein
MNTKKSFMRLTLGHHFFIRPFLPLLIGGWLDSNPQTHDQQLSQGTLAEGEGSVPLTSSLS